MCGIAGILLSSRAPDPARLLTVRPMTSSLRHRGPDGDGFWMDREAGVALGHRRLAIIDLSEAGHQPMLSHGGRLAITFNGEIYNFQGLRRELEGLGHRMQGGSDTEVMLAAIESWGLEAALRRAAGMFAIGVWDREARVLHLARDRMGKKPLYMAIVAGALVFASELKAILAVPGFRPEVDPRAVAAMMARGWVPDRHCILRDVVKLPPGCMLSIRATDVADLARGEALRDRVRPWWSVAEAAEAGRRRPLALSDERLVGELDRLLRQTVRERMVADVPLGAFLSGGIDSSTVVALMQAQSSRPVRTFTIGFGEDGYDESSDARRVAGHLGTEHTELHLTADGARDVIPDLPRIWDEPFADESQIPTLLVARLARQHVTVALSGDGGDECFAGYNRHVAPARLGPVLALSPALRGMVASAVRLAGRAAERGYLNRLPMPAGLRRSLRGDGLARLGLLLDSPDQDAIYDRLTALPGPLAALNAGGPAPESVPPLGDLVSRMIYRDMTGYLPDDILVKLDRASMATSLEARCPLLDHRVVEFSWRLPAAAKIRHGRGKWILRQVLARYVPKAMFERPKQGFDVPIAAWLRGPLRSWAGDLLDGARLRRQGLLDADRVQARWHEHLGGRHDRTRELWAALMLQAWLDAWVASDVPARAVAPEPKVAEL